VQIKILRKSALAALLVILAVSAPAGAQATGLNVSIKDRHLVVAYQAPGGILFGSVALRAPYQIVRLDALQFDFDASIQGEGDGSGVTGEGDGSGIAGEGDGSGVAGEGDGSGIAGEGDGSGVAGEGDGSGIAGEGDGSGIAGEGDGSGGAPASESTGIAAKGDGSGALIPAWGYAEVLLGCGRADVIIYSETKRGLEEAFVETVAVEYCAKP